MTLDAYLITRQWRDTPRGVELLFWATSASGAVRIIVESQQAVCFIERTVSLNLPVNVERHPRDLELLHHGPVDALYFRQQRQLQQLRQTDVPLCESDVKPAERYLMERFIRAAFSIEGDLQQHEGYQQVVNPRLTPCDFQPRLKTVSIDIETRGRTRQLYSIAAATMPGEDQNNKLLPEHPDNVVFMIGTGDTLQREGYTLYLCTTEKELLNRFFDWIQQADPDVLTGWAVVNFDLNFIDSKCRALGISFRLGRAGEQAAVLQPGNPGAPRIARVPGRAVLDGIDQLKAGFWSFDSFSLDNVSHELLGNGKLITPEQDKVATINRLFAEDKPQLADYNHRDCTLVNEIFEKAQLLPFAIQRANLTGLALDRLGGSVAAFDNLYLPRLHRKGYVAPDIRSHGDESGSPGGYVMDSKPGLYRNVLVLDFKSLYPSIIRTFFIDPLGLAISGEDQVPGFVDATFSREQHILPELIESLWASRDEAKKAGNAPLSQAIKIIMNSFYGVLGTTGCRFYSQQLASSITRRGHEIIQQSRDWIQKQGYEVIYGDTDSVFVWLGEKSKDSDGDVIGTQLMQGLNQWWHDQLQTRYRIRSHLEVEYETHYLRFFMPTIRGMSTGSKKRYAGLSADTTAATSELSLQQAKLVVKGLEAARTDWTPLARDFQKELFRRIFNDEPFEDFVRQIAQELNDGQLDEQLVYRKRIRRDLADYQRNVPPHIKAARKLPSSGNSIRYLITRNGPEPVEALVSAIDYQHYLDKQLAPAADGILQFMDTSFQSITDAQLQMF
ncbi:MAG: DNA polymerase II [Granulosicoccus sp.]